MAGRNSKAVVKRNVGGCPTKLSTNVKERFFEALRSGIALEVCCTYAGISYQTYRNWMERGEKAGRGEFFEFFEETTRVMAEAELKMFQDIKDAAEGENGDWKAKAFIMERRWPERYGKHETIKADVNHSGGVSIVFRHVSADVKRY